LFLLISPSWYYRLATSLRSFPTDEDAINTEQNAKGDSTVYGLACDGTNDSVIVFLPNSGGDPITYDIVGAMQNHRVIGKPQIGDWGWTDNKPQRHH
jgi:hypothetical protein